MIRVEFYGIPRVRAGRASTEVSAVTLGDVLWEVGLQFPELARECLEGQRLKRGYLASVNGTDFTTDPDRPLQPTDCVLILSADVGG